jgi:hypothetical protein
MIPLPYAADAEREIEAGADPGAARVSARRKAGTAVAPRDFPASRGGLRRKG